MNLDQHILNSNSETVDQCLQSMIQMDGHRQNYLKYRSVSRDVALDLNLNAIKYTQRRLIKIDKRDNSILLPDNYGEFSSLGYFDSCGKLQTLVHNVNLHADLIDISLDKDCHCECGCKSDLCGTIKHYEAVEEVTQELMPDDSTKEFTSTIRKTVYPDGSIYVEKEFPVRIYEGGEWTDVQLKQDKEYLCKLDVKKCGCIEDSTHNKIILNQNCSADTFTTDWGCTICGGENPEGYNFSEDGSKIILSSKFKLDKALLRFYPTMSIDEIRIPRIAKKTYMLGIKSYLADFDDDIQEYKVRRRGKSYEDEKTDLFQKLNRLSLKEYYQAILPRRKML